MPVRWPMPSRGVGMPGPLDIQSTKSSISLTARALLSWAQGDGRLRRMRTLPPSWSLVCGRSEPDGSQSMLTSTRFRNAHSAMVLRSLVNGPAIGDVVEALLLPLRCRMSISHWSALNATFPTLLLITRLQRHRFSPSALK